MRKLENFLNDYSRLILLGIGTIFVLWTMQVGAPIVEGIREEAIYQKNRNVELERKAGRELWQFSKELLEKAQIQGSAFGPNEYFRDLKQIEQKADELHKKYGQLVSENYYCNTHETFLRQLFMDNMKANRFTETNLQKYSQEYSEWKRSGAVMGDEFRKNVKERGLRQNLIDVGSWLWTIYLRGIPLLLIAYLVQMSGRKGILETILADKKKFLLAIAAWPFFATRYPANVVREVIVEAELRRLGGLFRQFSPMEKLRIQEIANSEEYVSLRKKIRSEYDGQFRWAFSMALLATFMIYFLQPVLKADAKETEHVSQSISVKCELDHGGQTDDDVGRQFPCENGSGICSFPAFIFEGMMKDTEIFLIQILARSIDTVPLCGCFGQLVFSRNHY